MMLLLSCSLRCAPISQRATLFQIAVLNNQHSPRELSPSGLGLVVEGNVQTVLVGRLREPFTFATSSSLSSRAPKRLSTLLFCSDIIFSPFLITASADCLGLIHTILMCLSAATALSR